MLFSREWLSEYVEIPGGEEGARELARRLTGAGLAVEQLGAASVDLRDPQPIGVWMPCGLDDSTHDDIAKIFAKRHEILDGRRACRDQVAKLRRRQIEGDKFLEPLVRRVHCASCSRNRMSES